MLCCAAAGAEAGRRQALQLAAAAAAAAVFPGSARAAKGATLRLAELVWPCRCRCIDAGHRKGGEERARPFPSPLVRGDTLR